MRDEPTRVLVVDDSPTIREVVCSMLEHCGFDTIAAGDGFSALEVLATSARIDVILLDFVMPRMNGFQFCRTLKARGPERSIPIVLMSAMADRIGERFIGQTGAVAAISKPFDAATLAEAVQGALGRGVAKKSRAPERKPGFSGSVAVVPLGAALQLIQLEAKTGVLSVRTASRTLSIALANGQVDFAQGEGFGAEFRFGRFLVEQGWVEPTELERAAGGRGQRSAAKPLGDTLIDLGKISHEQRQLALTRQSSELVYEALRWSEAAFEFHEEDLSELASSAKLQLQVPHLILEGFRRTDEWGVILEQLKSIDAVVVKNEAALVGKSFARKEQVIIDAIDGSRSVRDIVERCFMSSFETCKLLSKLLEQGIIAQHS